MRIFITIIIINLFLIIKINYAQDTISTSQAKDFVGEYKYIKGDVQQITTAKKSEITYINFDGMYPNQTFTAVIFKDKKDLFDLMIFRKSDYVVIYGLIELYKEKPQIILKEASQLVRWE